MTVFVGDIEGDGLLDTITKYHCLVFKPLGVNMFYVFCNEADILPEQKHLFDLPNIKFFPLDMLERFLNSEKTTGLIIHNIFGFDLPALRLLSGIEYTHNSINGRPVEITDSLVWSRYLNPERRLPKGCPTSVLNAETGRKDRIGPHGLAAWGYRTGVAKPTVNDWRNQPLHVYVNRCIEDVKINEAAYDMMLGEIRDVAIPNGTVMGHWERPLKMCQKVYFDMIKQEHTGVLFDCSKAEGLLVSIDAEMAEIEAEIEPMLGYRELPKAQQATKPTNIWKKHFDYKAVWTKTGALRKPVKDYLVLLGYTDPDSQVKLIKGMYSKDEYGDAVNNIEELLPRHESLLTATAVTYCNKLGIVDGPEMITELKRIEKGGSVKVLKERLKLKHKKQVKEFLIKDGWEPTLWKYRNIIVDKSTKQNLPDEEVKIKYDKYIKEFYGSIYWPFILKDLGYKNVDNVDITTPAFYAKVMKKGRGLMSSPQYKDQRGDRCVNIAKLYGEASLKIIRWLSLQNRRTTIKSPDKDTGWLNHPRIEIDGRLPARASGITPTSRQKHSVVVNVPKPSPEVVLGKEMRALFVAPEGWWNIGIDASGIEARVAGHFAYYYDSGQYARELLEGDVHTKNAKAYTSAIQKALLAKTSKNMTPEDFETYKNEVVLKKEILRSQGKNLTYAIMYGASGKKIALMASVDAEIGQQLIDAFWDANDGLKKAREALEDYWMATGKKYIMGIDGRKIFTRSKHSLMNSLFQSTGAIIIDFAGCWSGVMIEKEGLTAERWGVFHDEYQWYHIKSEVEIKLIDAVPTGELDKKGKPTFIKPEQIVDGKQWSVPILKDGVYTQYYSRVGELVAKGMEAAGVHFKMNLPFPGEYMVGASWADCH